MAWVPGCKGGGLDGLGAWVQGRECSQAYHHPAMWAMLPCSTWWGCWLSLW